MIDKITATQMKQRGGLSAPGKPGLSSLSGGSKSAFIIEGEDDDDDFDVDNETDEGEDLNVVPQEVLAKKKAEMSKTFEANRLKPGDKSFVYDKRVIISNNSSSIIIHQKLIIQYY